MKPIVLPDSYNYIGVFLTLRCNLYCPYCINRQGDLNIPEEMPGERWVEALSRIQAREDLPITLQGGEPTVHRDFYYIARNLEGKKMDLLTNGKFSLDEFIEYVHSGVFNRNAPYASIRFSYHKGLNDIYLYDKLPRLKKAGYNVGVWGFDCNDNEEMKTFCKGCDVDFRVKEMLDQTHGTYKYPEAIDGIKKTVDCRPSELLISPNGDIYCCHANLYAGIGHIGHILDEEVRIQEDFSRCDHCGLCNPCDIKLKTNRLQESGHCSVEIR